MVDLEKMVKVKGTSQAVSKKTLAIWDKALNKIATFDYSRLIPSFEVVNDTWPVKFPRVELTWKLDGPGIAFGFLYSDIWVGWPWQKKEIAR